MPAPSVTYTFTNGTTADATQVNQNFTDIINGLTDGTKDLSVAAITAAGTATLNGNVNLGNASGDDLTVTASLASTIPIKTTNLYNIGAATLGLAGIYLGSSGGAFTTRVIGAAVASSYTLTLPLTVGSLRNVLQTDGAGVTSFVPIRTSANDALNMGIACSVAASALTIALKGADGNDPSATNPVTIPFRSATSATGTVTERVVTAATSLVISSGSTLGHSSGLTQEIYIYALDNSGTVELAVSSSIFDEGSVAFTVAEGGAGASDSISTMYSTTSRSGVPFRLVGRLKSSQTVAGTWAVVPTEASVGNGMLLRANKYQVKILSANVTSNGTISDLTFNNLFIGKVYRAYIKTRPSVNQGATDQEVNVAIVHDGSNIERLALSVGAGTAAEVRCSVTAIFRATATILTFVSGGASANSFLQGDGTVDNTYARIEELNDYMQTTEFT